MHIPLKWSSPSPREDNSGGMPDNPDSSSLADPVMVQSPPRSFSRSSSKASHHRKSVKTDRQTLFPLQSSSSQATCLEVARGNLQKQGYSEEIANRILGPQRKSTRRLYGSRWDKFCTWCKSKETNPLKTTTPMIAEFLNYLFTVKKFSPGTIEGYKTAIAEFLKFHSDKDFNHNSILIRLIRSFKSERPRPSNQIPKWDLALVLNFFVSCSFWTNGRSRFKVCHMENCSWSP